MTIRRLAEIERRYEEILRSATSDEDKDRQLAALMADMEQTCGVPPLYNATWARKHRTLAAMYRKIIMSRSFSDMLWGYSKEILKKEWCDALKSEDKKSTHCLCGSSSQLTYADYTQGWTVVHNTPVYKCPKCKEELFNSSVLISIEGIAFLTKLPEIDYRQIGELIEALSESMTNGENEG